MKKHILLLFSLFSFLGMNANSQPVEGDSSTSRVTVKTGIEVLRDKGFAGLAGRRVGLVTNPSGVDRHLKSTIDILFEAPEVSKR